MKLHLIAFFLFLPFIFFAQTNSDFPVFSIINQPPAADRIHVGADLEPWIITTGKEVWRLIAEQGNNKKWIKVDGCGNDIGGSDVDVYLVGCGLSPFGFPVYKWNPALNPKFEILDGAGMKISGGSNGSFHMTNKFGNIFKRENNRYRQINGIAWDIAAAGDHVFRLGNEYTIWKLISINWVRVDGYGQNLATDESGNLWVSYPDGTLYEKNTSLNISGVKDVAACLAPGKNIGMLWTTGVDGSVHGYYYRPGNPSQLFPQP